MVFTLYGQLILKWRISDHGALPESSSDKIFFLLRLFTDGYILSGFIAAFLASLAWMATMTKFDLSHAYPIIVGGLAISTSFFAILFLKEPINMAKVLGLLLIVTGVLMVGKGN